VNADRLPVFDAVMKVQKWLQDTHNCTFEVLPAVRINVLNPPYDSIKEACRSAGIAMDIPTYAWAPGPVQPGSMSDAEMLAVKEVTDLGIVAHELAHLWTGTGAESHDVVIEDADGNAFNTPPKPSVLGSGQFTFPQAQLAPIHLEMALARGYIRRI
jgi:hypothetical protein